MQIRDYLESNQISCWIAKRNIPAGADYAVEIPKAIDACLIFLLILSPFSQESQYVRSELEWAIKHKKKIIPLMLSEFQLTNAIEFHLQNFQRISAYELRQDEADKMLLQRINDILANQLMLPSTGELNPATNIGVPPKSSKHRVSIAINRKNKHDIPLKQLQDISDSLLPTNIYTTKTLDEMGKIADCDRKSDLAVFLQLIPNAVADNPDAQLELGKRYHQGQGVYADQRKALYWFTKAAAHKNTNAMFHLGECYKYGRGTKRNPVKAAYWFEEAASQPDSCKEAVFEIANCYCWCTGVTHDVLKAAYWLAKAASYENVPNATHYSQVQQTEKCINYFQRLSVADKQTLSDAGYPTTYSNSAYMARIESLKNQKESETKSESLITSFAVIAGFVNALMLTCAYAYGTSREEWPDIDMKYILIILCIELICSGLHFPLLYEQALDDYRARPIVFSLLQCLATIIIVPLITVAMYYYGLWTGYWGMAIPIGFLGILLFTAISIDDVDAKRKK
jgi:TPR repeat protein